MSSIPFGIHKNKPLLEVPRPYLTWTITQTKLTIKPRLRSNIELVLNGTYKAPKPITIAPTLTGFTYDDDGMPSPILSYDKNAVNPYKSDKPIKRYSNGKWIVC